MMTQEEWDSLSLNEKINAIGFDTNDIIEMGLNPEDYEVKL